MDPRGMLRLGYGLVPIVAGADKFTNLLVDWEKYLSPAVERALPIPGRTFMKIVGIVEIAAGLAVLSPLRRLGALTVAGWLGGITLNLLSTGKYFDIAARDALLAIGALALGQLEKQRRPERSPAPDQPRLDRQPLQHSAMVAPAVH